MIETEESKKEFEKRTGRTLSNVNVNAQSVAQHAKTANVNRKSANINTKTTTQTANINKRANYMRDYMRAYRKRPKVCPHCGGKL
jgi:formamidopyrimidine-DNA glycosylase